MIVIHSPCLSSYRLVAQSQEPEGSFGQPTQPAQEPLDKPLAPVSPMPVPTPELPPQVRVKTEPPPSSSRRAIDDTPEAKYVNDLIRKYKASKDESLIQEVLETKPIKSFLKNLAKEEGMEFEDLYTMSYLYMLGKPSLSATPKERPDWRTETWKNIPQWTPKAPSVSSIAENWKEESNFESYFKARIAPEAAREKNRMSGGESEHSRVKGNIIDPYVKGLFKPDTNEGQLISKDIRDDPKLDDADKILKAMLSNRRDMGHPGRFEPAVAYWNEIADKFARAIVKPEYGAIRKDLEEKIGSYEILNPRFKDDPATGTKTLESPRPMVPGQPSSRNFGYLKNMYERVLDMAEKEKDVNLMGLAKRLVGEVGMDRKSMLQKPGPQKPEDEQGGYKGQYFLNMAMLDPVKAGISRLNIIDRIKAVPNISLDAIGDVGEEEKIPSQSRQQTPGGYRGDRGTRGYSL